MAFADSNTPTVFPELDVDTRDVSGLEHLTIHISKAGRSLQVRGHLWNLRNDTWSETTEYKQERDWERWISIMYVI